MRTRYTDTWIYAIRRPDTGEVKIGHAKEPAARMAILQTGSAVQLELAMAYFCPGSVLDEERAIHRRFSPHHIRGEWFVEAPEVATWITEKRRASPTASSK